MACIPVVRFLFDWLRGFDFLIYQYLVDDAFYYFEISRHIPEFNAGIPTSGFHPLFAFLVSPLHTWLDYHAAIPLSLLLLVLAHAAGAVVLYYLLSTIWDEPIPLLCAAAWAVDGKLYGIAMCGLEVPLAVLLVLAFLARFLAREPHERGAPRGYLVLGLLAGLAFLARMDAPLILAPAMAFLLGKVILCRRFAFALLTVIPALALPVAWLAYVKIKTGALVPTSAAALRVMRGIDGQLLAPKNYVVYSLQVFYRNVRDYFAAVPETGEILFHAAFVLGGALGLVLLARSAKTRSQGAIVRFDVLVVVGLLLWGAYYVFHQGGFRFWYFAYFGIAAHAVYLPLVFVAVFHFRRLVRWPRLASCLLVAALALLSQTGPRGRQEYDKYHSALAADRIFSEIRAEGNVGSFNAGIFDYFMTKDVVNLDGVVNPEALEAMRRDDLPAYLRAKGIVYIIEHEVGESVNFHRIHDDDRLELRRWIDLRQYYLPYGGSYVGPTFLWMVAVKSSGTEAPVSASGRARRP